MNDLHPKRESTLASRPRGASGECLTPDTVDAFTRGELSPSSIDQLERHIASCSPCRELLSELVQLGFTDEEPPVTAAPNMAPASDITMLELGSGSQVGRYVILQRLGEGEMGVVFSAHDPELSRKVALKLLRGDFAHAQQGTLRERLRREAQAMAQMAHPNVVTVYDVGTWGDLVFIAMEFIDGETLSQWLECGPHSWGDVLAMFLPAGYGLAAAHAVGVVHRDFKPANVLVGLDGRVRVGDFGLAAINASPAQSINGAHGSAALTADLRRTGSIAGTPYYMAPEHLLGRFTDARSDQFSFCVALYQAIAGHHPFDRRQLADGLAAAGKGPPSRTRVPPAAMPRWLHRVLLRGLSVDPADRFPSMPALLEALTRKPRRRWPAVASVLAATALVAAGLLQLRETASTKNAAPDRAVHVVDWPPYNTRLFAGAPELLHAYERDFAAMHTSECESPQVRCAVQATNLLRNAGFDRAGRAWQSGAGPSGARLDWQSGSLRVTTLAPNGSIAQEVPWIAAPGQGHSLRAWIRAPRGSPPTRGRLMLWGIGRASAVSATTRFLTGPEWSEVSVTLVPNVHTDRFRAELYLDSPSSVEVDGTELVDAGLMDPSFEQYRATAWQPCNFPTDVEVRSAAGGPGASEALDGARWLELRTSKGMGSIAQDTNRIPLVGTTYTFVAWLRTGPDALTAQGHLALWALGERRKVSLTAFETTAYAWQRVEVSLDIEEHGYTGLRAEIYLASTDTWLRVDAAMLIPAGLVDASFERGSSAWYSPQGAGTMKAQRIADTSPAGPTGLFVSGRSVDHAKNGTFWLRLNGRGNGGSIAQDLPPPLKGSTYTFSAWVRAASGSMQSASGSLLIEAMGGKPAQGRTDFRVSAEWTLVTATLEVERDGHTGLRVVIESTDSRTELDVDGTRLTGASFIPPGN